MEHATPAEARLLAGSCTVATLLPSVWFHGGRGPAAARSLIDAGVPVAIATNFNPQHTPTLSMQTAVALACIGIGMMPAEAISAGTINGAHALGVADRVGSLEPGKQADLLILNASDYRDLTRDFGVNLVHKTMKRGELIYEEGEVVRRDAERLRSGLPRNL
jgi:imidazolonepropionase